MNDRLNIAIMQLMAHGRDQFSRTRPQLLEMIETTAQQGVELIVCPEGTIPAYVLGPQPITPDEYLQTITELEALTRKYQIHLICGGVHVVPNVEHPEDAALVFGPDGFIAGVGKRFLWHFDRHWFTAGHRSEPLSTAIGKFGILICADGRIPTLAGTLVDRGAELLILPTAWVSNAADEQHYENIQADLFVRVRAWENGVPLLAANKVGVELGSVLYCGKSQILDADGNIIALASHNQPEILHHTISLRTPRPHRSTTKRTSPQSTPVGSSPLRMALALPLDRRHYEVAQWSDVDVLFSLDEPLCSLQAEPSSTKTSQFPHPHVLTLSKSKEKSLLEMPGFRALILDDDEISDPGMLPPYRLAGIDFFLWRMQLLPTEMRMLLARTRAVELRSYICAIALQPNERSYIVDPDGVILAGTTTELRMIQWVYDPRRTAQTCIVPGTDILNGLCLMDDEQFSLRSV